MNLHFAHILLIISFVTSFVVALISVDQQVKHQFVSVRLWPKMASIVDSEAHLAKRATEVGLTDGALQSLVRNGLSTLGRLAFAHGQPGTPIDAAAFHTFAQNLLGALMSLADEAALKRLLFEGHTMVLSQLREAVANPEAAHTSCLRWKEMLRWLLYEQPCLVSALRNSWSPAIACWIWCRNNLKHNSWLTCHQIVALHVSGRWPWEKLQSRSNWTQTTW